MSTNNNTLVQPYLMFDGRCDEAIEFYKKSLGAEVVMLMRFKDCPEPPQDGSCAGSGAAEKVMHANLRIGTTNVMLSDGHCAGKPVFEGFCMSLSAATDAETEKYFNALAEGGQVRMPVSKTFFSSRFGMVADKFGVCWMVLTTPHENK